MNERWQTACHEAGHAIASIVLGGKAHGVVLFPGGGGQAQIDELLADRLAYSIAAGPAAERLAKEHPAPTESPVESILLSVDEVEALPVFASAPYIACQMARSHEDRKNSATDAQILAHWAIRGCEDVPEAWAGRVAHAHRMAAEIVRRNAESIVRVARALFVAGSLSEIQILNQMEG